MNHPACSHMRQAAYGILAKFRRQSVLYIGGSDTLPPPLTKEEELALMEHMRTEEDMVRTTLIERNLRLVVYIARKFENTGIGLEDLISIGTIGLIKAVNSFNPEKKIKLATYASRCMEVSLDQPLNTDWDGNELLLSDILGTEPDLVSRDLDASVEKQLLHVAISRLDPREQHIVGLRYGLIDGREHTQKEVADMMGISQSYISRLEKRIIRQLHEDMEKMA